MNLKDRIKTTSFWVGLIGAVFLILSAFGVEIGDETASSVINAVCSILVLFGVVSAPQKQTDETESEPTEPDKTIDEVADEITAIVKNFDVEASEIATNSENQSSDEQQ